MSLKVYKFSKQLEIRHAYKNIPYRDTFMALNLHFPYTAIIWCGQIPWEDMAMKGENKKTKGTLYGFNYNMIIVLQ